MKQGFFQDLKHYLLTQKDDELNTFIPYYETLHQMSGELTELLDYYDRYFMEIQHQEDMHGGYTNGILEVHFFNSNPSEGGWQDHIGEHFNINLEMDERYWGYCDCELHHEGYNEKYQCCGNGCDWVAPRVNVVKMTTIANSAFNGQAKDMWTLEGKWGGSIADLKEKERSDQLNYIEEQIKELERRKQLWLNK